MKRNNSTLSKKDSGQSPPDILHLFDGDLSFRPDTHNLGSNAQLLVSVEKCYPRYWVVHFTDDRITLPAQLAADAVEIANRQAECNVLYAACRIARQVVMEHALAGNPSYVINPLNALFP